MRISKFLQEDAAVLILLVIYEREKVRHRDLALIVRSRGSLSNSLNALLDDGLVAREVDIEFRPARSYYKLTKKGHEVARCLKVARRAIAGPT